MEKETHHHYTDQGRYEYYRKCRISGKTVSEFARDNGIKRGTRKLEDRSVSKLLLWLGSRQQNKTNGGIWKKKWK